MNLRDIKGEKLEKSVRRKEFEEFVKVVSKAVYMTAEGIYQEE